MKCRKTLDDVKAGANEQHRDQVGRSTADCPIGIRHEGGVNWQQVSLRNVGTCRPDAKGETQAEATASVRLRRHFSRNPKWIHPISGAKNGRRVLPSAARARPASARAHHFAVHPGFHNDFTPVRLPYVLSPPALPRGLRQNIRPSGYAGVVAHRSSAIAPSLPVLLQRTDAGHRGGVTRSRVEGSVMGLDRRGGVVRLYYASNPRGEDLRG